VAYTSEIDKLEARFRENPKGRNFAPLADAYRKAGLIDNAIELCQNGLKTHPDYVSAYIVYARCLIDKKDDAGAHDVFRKVLDLDGENIIALRVLAEIAERNKRFEEAVEWLSRLLNADPMNGDAAEALARAKAKVTSAPIAAIEKPEFAVDKETPEPVTLTPGSTPSARSPDIENFENPISFNPNAHAAAKAEGLEVQEDVELNSQQIEQVEIEGLARTQYEGSGMFKLDSESQATTPPADEEDGQPQVDLPLIMPDDLPVARAQPGPPPPPQPPAPPSPAPPDSPRARVPAAVALSDDDGAADTATLSQAEPVVTETMAELYLKQGHQQDALRVYQALLAQRPTDARLRSKVEHLASGGRKGSGVSAQAFLKGIWSGRGAPAAPAEQSTLAAAFDAAGPPPGEPSRPAQDHISLDSVFGDDAARRSKSQASGSAETGTTSESKTPGEAGGGFSFDDFFAGSKAPASEPAGEPVGTPKRPSGRTQHPPEDEADADQFQQWLKKLKS
jgi:tetratricopeptide (TPR) repeat protein